MTGVIDKASTSQQTGGGGRSEDKQQKDNLKQKDKGSLEQTDAWLQQQVTRYKTEAENAIKAKEQVSMEKRRLQRELRKAMHKMEEMEMKNSQLLNRKEKTKSVTSH
ncbi:hypothetical protein GDO81_012036 [Engystomops pustulosus]|uniref:Uncharacterized protein n=2 Tax=Engystomops pustulosus TaxID=76066 RepID=A0AAV7BIS7_ENGPU|nr:hypothetical protein GDO81_012036 [Engystomops pustulosus]